MIKKARALAMFALLSAFSFTSEAQEPAKALRIGILLPGPLAPRKHLVEAFRQGLRDLGYTQRDKIALVVQSPEQGSVQLSDLALELVKLKVDAIVTGGPSPIQAARRATRTIPLVMAGHPDPVESGLIANLARPGGNITGMSITAGLELYGKRLELLKEIVPKVSRINFLFNPNTPANTLQARETEAAARTLGVYVRGLEVRVADELERAFEATTRARAGGVLVLDNPLFNSHRKRIVDLAAKNRMPAMYGFGEFIDAGGLMVYGANLTDVWRRAATFVDKILKGAKPAELPVEQPTKFEFVINLKAAKQIGLTIPPNMLARADRVIK